MTSADRDQELVDRAKKQLALMIDVVVSEVVFERDDKGNSVDVESTFVVREVTQKLSELVIGDKVIFLDTGYWKRTIGTESDPDETRRTKRDS